MEIKFAGNKVRQLGVLSQASHLYGELLYQSFYSNEFIFVAIRCKYCILARFICDGER